MYLSKIAHIRTPTDLIVVEIRTTEDRRNVYAEWLDGGIRFTKGMFSIDPVTTAQDAYDAALVACLIQVVGKHGPMCQTIKYDDPPIAP